MSWEDQLLGLAAKIEAAGAEAASAALRREMKATVGAGTAPDGKPWPAKKGGGRALSGAASGLIFETSDAVASVAIGVPLAYHDGGAGGSSDSKGAARAKRYRAKKRKAAGTASKFHAPKRQIIPTEMTPRIRKALLEEFRIRGNNL